MARLSAAADHAREFAVDDDRFCLAVVEHESDRGRIEAGVERVEDGAAHRDAIVAFEHRGRVGEHDRDRVAANETSLGERGGEFLRSRVELAITAAQRPVSDRQPIRKHRSGALEKRERRQRLIISGIAIEIAIVGREGHRAELHGASLRS